MSTLLPLRRPAPETLPAPDSLPARERFPAPQGLPAPRGDSSDRRVSPPDAPHSPAWPPHSPAWPPHSPAWPPHSPAWPPHGPASSPRASTPEPLWRQAVGAQLRAERSERHERLVDVAGRAGVSAQYLSEVERGRKDPSSEVLAAVAGALDVTVVDLTRRAATRLESLVSTTRNPVCLAA